MEARAVILPFVRLHQRERLGADLDRLLELAAEHQETRLSGQRLRTCERRRPVGSGLEGEGEVAVHCGSVAELPGEARGRGRRFGLPFDVSRDPKRFQRLRQQLQAGAAERVERASALEQKPRPGWIVGHIKRKRVGKECRGRCIRR